MFKNKLNKFSWSLMGVSFLAFASLSISFLVKAQLPDSKTTVDAKKVELSIGSQQAQKQARNLSLAQQLAKYGKENNAPLALVNAAQILLNMPNNNLQITAVENPSSEINNSITQIRSKRTRSASRGQQQEKVTQSTPLTAKNLLEEAKKMAQVQGNKQLVMMIDNITARGATHPAHTWYDDVDAYDYNAYEIEYRGREIAIFEAYGDGDTDIDCYVFDRYGNVVDYDDDYTDICYLEWYPSRTSVFTIVVENLGDVYNEVGMWHN